MFPLYAQIPYVKIRHLSYSVYLVILRFSAENRLKKLLCVMRSPDNWIRCLYQHKTYDAQIY